MDFLFDLLFEIVGQLVMEIVVEAGFEAGKGLLARQPRLANVVVAAGALLAGALAGWLSAKVAPTRLTHVRLFPGISLAAGPFVGALTMELYGRWRRSRAQEATRFATWWGGAAFAFGYALTRFVLVA